ncbi:hypothetical protein [Streptomyces purpurogeneiscleroticus]|uniref:hypothetical protein n=1 Tax=Streptomyces purpurogeneiscleroticus TaxID=68259 RepID=UPI0027E1D5D3|nr:hypothetical protein [Streptomyces purpurogeneiscleroticus]
MHGTKRTENRPQPWSWRGWLLLHAGRTLDHPALRNPLVATTLRGRDLPSSAILGVARLADCHADDGPCSPWAHPGQYHLVLTDVSALPLPVPAVGALGPWRPLPDVLDQVLLQLPHLGPEAQS